MRELIQPTQPAHRTAIIDMLRGWALLGVVLMNFVDYYYLGLDFKTFKPDVATSVMMGIGQFVFAAKSWTMLSFLFGYGFAVLMENVSKKGLNPYKFFVRRMFWLFVIAIINSALFFGDILKDYAIMGLILLLFYRCSARVCFYFFLGLLLIIPAVSAFVSSLKMPGGMAMLTPILPLFESRNPLDVLWFGLFGTYKFEILSPGYLITVHVVMLACFMLGLTAQKIDFFNNLAKNKMLLKQVFWGSLVFTLLLVVFLGLSQSMKWPIMQVYNPGFLFVLGSMVFFVASLSWLYVSGKLKGFFTSMQTIGKMTLTNYITQNALALVLFSGAGFGLSLGHRIHYGYYLLFAFIIYVAQIFLSKWWLRNYYYGPVEWVWRQLSYGKKLPLKKSKAEIAVTPVSKTEPIVTITT